MSSNNRKTGNLVALGSAAVVAVYGAGFMRTAAAAERFAQQSNERVLTPAEAEVIASMVQDTARALAAPTATANGNVVQPSAPASMPATKVDATTAKVSSSAIADSKVAAPSDKKPVTASAVATQDAKRDTASKETDRANAPATTQPATASPTNVAAVAAQSQATASTAAQTVAAPPAAVVSGAQSTTTPATPTTSTPAPVAPVATKVDETAPTPAESKPALKWKDGNYTGYGTSRHGDIEVYLETDAGKISYIKISQCLTQYSCSWISHLPGQVIARQGPNVDGVSGATQSVNAFYYAVVQALAKAK